MARRVGAADPDRHLGQRNGFFTYKRRVPAKIGERDSRFPVIRLALGTDDIGEARLKRDTHERADDELWAALLAGAEQFSAIRSYKAAVSRAEALGFTYRHLSSILTEESGTAILARLRATHDQRPGSLEEAVVLGAVERPKVTLDEAFALYATKIAASSIKNKSPHQRKHWKISKERAIRSFQAVVGKRNIDDITRQDALTFYYWWLDRIAPDPDSGKKPTHKPNSANREIGNLRVLYSAYFSHMGDRDANNPFDKLNFEDKKIDQRKRPPFPTEWIVNVILKPGSLATLNEEARAIVLTLVETGARPSEICNLRPDQIRLQHPVPHLAIEGSDDPDDPREIKTASSIREIPLVGVALDAMKKFPHGFPKYLDKSSVLSATVNKYLKENELIPTKKHVLYSLRHSFEDRAKESHMDTEMRMILMGHTSKRPEYGSGGSLEWRLSGLSKMALPYDPAIV